MEIIKKVPTLTSGHFVEKSRPSRQLNRDRLFKKIYVPDNAVVAGNPAKLIKMITA
ncbi:MAG: hypothetical protein IKO66_03030 [Paludibacteraceae bacterium]|nr:hypothetical protein [Paludibacteraceae bacterium]